MWNNECIAKLVRRVKCKFSLDKWMQSWDLKLQGQTNHWTVGTNCLVLEGQTMETGKGGGGGGERGEGGLAGALLELIELTHTVDWDTYMYIFASYPWYIFLYLACVLNDKCLCCIFQNPMVYGVRVTDASWGSYTETLTVEILKCYFTTDQRTDGAGVRDVYASKKRYAGAFFGCTDNFILGLRVQVWVRIWQSEDYCQCLVNTRLVVGSSPRGRPGKL